MTHLNEIVYLSKSATPGMNKARFLKSSYLTGCRYLVKTPESYNLHTVKPVEMS